MHMDNVFLLAHTEWGTRLDISLQCTVADCQWPSTLSLLSPCTVSAWHRRWPEEREQTVSSAKATTLTLYYNKLGLKAIWTWRLFEPDGLTSGVARLGYNGAHTPGLCAKVRTNIVCPCGVLVMSWLRHCGSHTVWLATFMRDLFSHLSWVWLWWLSLAIQEIEMLHKHRHMKPDSGYFPRHTEQELKLQSLSVNDSRHSLSF